MKRALLLALTAWAGGAAFAQSEGKNDPLKADASVPAVTYRSAFEGYRPYREQEVASWREVNEEVARTGGHAGHVQKGDKAQKPSPAKPAAGGQQHGGHR